jgi:2-methylcitrate dehydratase PrpD
MKTITKNTNQALELALFASEFLKSGTPSLATLTKAKYWNTDLILSGLNCLNLEDSVSNSYKKELNSYKSTPGCNVMGSNLQVFPEKAVMVNCYAIEEFYENDITNSYVPNYFPVVIAAFHQKGLDGTRILNSMVLIEEIRSRLRDVINISQDINEAIHGGIACTVVYGCLIGATPKQIEYAQGMVIESLSANQPDKNKPSDIAAASVLSVAKAMAGITGLKDLFRTSFLAEKPFDLNLSFTGEDFAINSLTFRIGMYELSFATAIEALLSTIRKDKSVLKNISQVNSIEITVSDYVYSLHQASSKIHTFFDAFTSLSYVISTVYRKCLDLTNTLLDIKSTENIWKNCILYYDDYSPDAIQNPTTNQILGMIKIVKGGESYNICNKYPASIKIIMNTRFIQSSIVDVPMGHPEKFGISVKSLIYDKNYYQASFLLEKPKFYLRRLDNIDNLSSEELLNIYNYKNHLTSYFRILSIIAIRTRASSRSCESFSSC